MTVLLHKHYHITVKNETYFEDGSAVLFNYMGGLLMRIQLTKQECIWLAELAKKERHRAEDANWVNPHRIFQLRRDNMTDIENKLNQAIQKEIQKERNDAR